MCDSRCVKFCHPFRKIQHAEVTGETRRELPEATPAGIHDWQICRVCDDEAYRGFPPSLVIRVVGINLPDHCAAWNRSGAYMGASLARLLSSNHFPDQISPQPPASRRTHQVRLFLISDVHYRRSHFPCCYGVYLRYEQYPLCVSGSVFLPSLCTLFCDTRVPSGR